MMRIASFAVLLLVSIRPACAFDPFQETGIDQRPGAKIPFDMSFHDESGAGVTLRSLAQGKPMLLVPVLHNCPNICGVTLGGLLQAVETQSYRPGSDFSIVAFGIDPKEGSGDAAASLDKLMSAFPSLPRSVVHGLTGSAGNVAAVTKALGYRYAWDERIGQYAHIAATAVLTSDGRLSHWLYGVAPEPTDIKLALTEAGNGEIGSWGDQLLLLCYHYDPDSGRYNSLVWLLLRGVGAVTAIAGISLIGRALYRERQSKGRGAP